LNERLAKRLFDAHLAAAKVGAITRSLSFDDYEASELTRLAVERLLEIVSEALGAALREDPELEDRYPDLRRAVSLRNRIIHGYDDVNDQAIWDIVQTNIPTLTSQLVSILHDYGRQRARLRPGRASMPAPSRGCTGVHCVNKQLILGGTCDPRRAGGGMMWS
jgi:uncharacterized protein with HEPN domain